MPFFDRAVLELALEIEALEPVLVAPVEAHCEEVHGFGLGRRPKR